MSPLWLAYKRLKHRQASESGDVVAALQKRRAIIDKPFCKMRPNPLNLNQIRDCFV